MLRPWFFALPLASCLLAACSSSQADSTAQDSADAGEAPDNAVTSVLAPTTFVATAGCTSAWLTWAAPTMPTGTTLTGYSVQQATTTAGPWTNVANCLQTSTAANCAALALTGGSTYSFRVAAITKTGTVSSTGPYSSTATPAAIHTIGTTCVNRDLGPGGGKLYKNNSFACGPTLSSTCTFLEIGPNLGSMAWCQKLNKVTGAVGTNVGTGAPNTAAMIAIGCTSGAGFAANAYRGGGFSDWYLPSEIEVFIANNLLFQYKNVSTEIKPVTWSSTTWWTSTQTSTFNSTASTVKIDTAVLVNSALGKASSAEVHPIRTF